MVDLSRREALGLFSKLSSSLYLAPFFTGGCSLGSLAGLFDSRGHYLALRSPIDRLLPDDPGEPGFFGDNPDKSHAALWNKAQFIANHGGLPQPTSHRRLVVVGGGVSGLTSAYFLRDLDPLVIERDRRFGGNSKGQAWHGTDYSIGAAYFCVPEEGGHFAQLLRELGLAQNYRRKSEEDPIAINGVISQSFWSGAGLEPRAQAQVVKAARYFKGVFNEESEPYPDPLARDAGVRKRIEALDVVSFRDHLDRVIGPLQAPLSAVIEQFCWSSFAASATEISAAAGLNFMAAEFGEIGVFPGGNAAIAEALFNRLVGELGEDSLRADSLVLDLRVENGGVTVTYLNSEGVLEAVRADCVVAACPKFVTSKLIDDLEEPRRKSIGSLEYRAYLVANVLLKGDLFHHFYDLYLLGDGMTAGRAARTESERRGVTDVVCANYATDYRGDTVLTLYRALPYSGGRGEILNEGSYAVWHKKFERQLQDEILPLLGVDAGRVKGLRIARWGHPIPVAARGLIASGVVDQLQRPFKDRIFFVEQDNWALPAVETAIGEAHYWSEYIRRNLA